MSEENKSEAGKVEFNPVAPKDWLIDDLAKDHERNERRFTSLERRLSSVEKRGSLLPNIDQENVMFYLMAAYIIFGFILPALIDLFRGKEG
jgi:hypothetical protein